MPQPTIATRLPRRLTLVQACTALPNGSCTAATSGRILRRVGAPEDLRGQLHELGEAPSWLMPMILSSAQTWVSPMRHW